MSFRTLAAGYAAGTSLPLLVLVTAHAGLPAEHELFADLVARMDADADGRLTEAEYTPFDAGGTFPSIDLDRDGAITVEELQGWVLVTEPRPMDRPPRTAAMILAGGGAPSFLTQPAKPTSGPQTPSPSGEPADPGGVSGHVGFKLGGMALIAAALGAWVLRKPPPRRRGR